MSRNKAATKKSKSPEIIIALIAGTVSILSVLATGIFGYIQLWIPIQATKESENRQATIVSIGITQTSMLVNRSPTPTPQIQNTPELTPQAIQNPSNRVILPTEFFIFSQDKVMYDDFSQDTSGWGVDKTDGDNVAGYQMQGKTLYMFLGNQAGYFSVFWEQMGERYLSQDFIAYQVEVLGPWGKDGAAKQGIVFGVNSQMGKVSWAGTSYAFDLTNDGWCRLTVRKNENPWEVAIDSSTNTPVQASIPDFDNSQSHFITVRMEKKNFQGYVDGRICLADVLDDYIPGYAGVVGKGSKDGVLFYFDNFEIFVPKR